LNMHEWFKKLKGVSFVKCRPFRVYGGRDHGMDIELKTFSPDVLFIPMERHYGVRGIPTVNMIQNMLPMVSISNNTVREGIRNVVQREVARRAVLRAERTIAISNFVKEYLCIKWSICEEKVGLVPYGVDIPENKDIVKPGTLPDEWRGRFIFSAGSIEPFRGLEDILLLAGQMSRGWGCLQVVIAGSSRPAMEGYGRHLRSLAREMGPYPSVIWLGQLTRQEMFWCYRNCRAFLMTSRVEACPNIALEAMAHGCVSVCAENPPLPEFFGNAAIYYAAGNRESLLDALGRMESLGDNGRAAISAAAIARARYYSWEKTTDGTVRELKKAITARRAK
jgi:glycosyltransferase involved in cell wall biosynthesis